MPHHFYVFTVRGNEFNTIQQQIQNTLNNLTTCTTSGQSAPRIIVHDSINGISKMELVNFRESVMLMPYWSFLIEISGITSNRINNNNNNSNNSIQRFQFDTECLEMNGITIDHDYRLLDLSELNANASMYFRFPIFLKDYSFKIRIRRKLTFKDTWSDWSKKHQITIKSDIIRKHYFNIGDTILFKPLHCNNTLKGKIVRKDTDKELYKIEASSVPKYYYNIDKTRIYTKGPHLKHLIVDIDTKKQNKMYKELLLNSCFDDEYDRILNVLSDVYETYAQNDHYDSSFIIDIGKFMAINIVYYLINAGDSEDNLMKCIFDSKHGKMKIISVWYHSIVNHIKLLKYVRNQTKYKVLNPTLINECFTCDLCGIEISIYDWIYVCNGGDNILNKHFICLLCIHNVIIQHNAIQELLVHHLSKYLYNDCIQLIANFVCSEVIYPNY